MPTYSYLCDACGSTFEKEQRIVEDAIKTCAVCGKDKARRQIVSGNFILKGGGWYSDGYGNSSKKSAKADPVAKADKPDTSSKTSEKADSTPKAEKSESTPKADATSSAAKGGTSKAQAAS
jgi:putative FmdB family regulatory protein